MPRKEGSISKKNIKDIKEDTLEMQRVSGLSFRGKEKGRGGYTKANKMLRNLRRCGFAIKNLCQNRAC
jgi:hypothetical protein